MSEWRGRKDGMRDKQRTELVRHSCQLHVPEAIMPVIMPFSA